MTAPVAASFKPPPKGFDAWSFSRYNAYRRCPLAAKLSLIDKLPQPGSAAMARGESIHKLAAAYIQGEHPQIPESLRMFEDLFGDLRQRHRDGNVVAEDSWAFRRDWSVTAWDDWAECWVRIKIDAARLIDNDLDILDWKTGKFSPQYNLAEYAEQIELYSLGALIMFGGALPDLAVSPRLVYLDHGIVWPEDPKVFTLADLPRLRKQWEGRVRPMLADRTFAPKPGNYCRWCAFSKSAGGPCAF